jgi:hypothetical protein
MRNVEVLHRVKGGEEYRTYSKKKRLIGFVTSSVGTVF